MLTQIAVLAGGLATRLYPITETMPKSMVPIAGKPFLEHQLNLFRKNHIKQVVLCVGHLYEQIQDYFGDGRNFGLKIQYSLEKKKLDTGGALKNAQKFLNSEFFVIYGDSYLLTDYQKVYNFFKNRPEPGLMTIYQNNNRLEPSRILIDGCYIKKYRKDPPPPRARYCEYGLNIFQKKILNLVLKKGFPISEYFDLLGPKKQLLNFDVKERFYEIGCPRGLKEVCQILTHYGKKTPTKFSA